ncbi:glycosyltransferase family 4 protein [Alcaligenaceae bacterium CGII-47]|nr:glycosyltransferase family 4 protein [Alcaligenaceae bacterium CGII-47]
MKLAIVHDWLITYSGAERVLAEMLHIWPDADLFSVIDFLCNSDREIIGGKSSTTTFIQRMPGARKYYQLYLPLMTLAIEQLDLSGYDVILSSSHAVAKGVLVGPDQLHICYCHSPIRYAWDMQHQYLSESGLSQGIKSILARMMLYKIRNWDHRTSNGVDYFISNSNYIGRRIAKAYRRKSKTIYPNVAVDDFPLRSDKDDFYLTASRLVPYKKVDLIVRAFAGMPQRRLIVIGDGPQAKRIRESATSNITMLGHRPFSELCDHMQRARAFVFAAEEDFGIVSVEAQACGTPVIAFGRGGSRETVIDGVTGVLFDEQSETSIRNAIESFETNFKGDGEVIRRHAQQFSATRFRKEIESFVDEKYKLFLTDSGL